MILDQVLAIGIAQGRKGYQKQRALGNKHHPIARLLRQQIGDRLNQQAVELAQAGQLLKGHLAAAAAHQIIQGNRMRLVFGLG